MSNARATALALLLAPACALSLGGCTDAPVSGPARMIDPAPGRGPATAEPLPTATAASDGEDRGASPTATTGNRLGGAGAGGSAGMPDLLVDREQLEQSVEIVEKDFPAGSCEIQEGCVAGPGRRRLIRWDTATPNLGTADMHFGAPSSHPDLFEYSMCHDHYHFKGYAEYELDGPGGLKVLGRKQAFCLEDIAPYSNRPSSGYTCDFQGISMGWGDIYSKDLPCQWIDITDVPTGDYKLLITVNPEGVIQELDRNNNTAGLIIHVP